MFKIVDKYILRTFIPLFVMSFAVCWFIVVMQFLWRYIDELVGKGLSGFMLLKIILYAALLHPDVAPSGYLAGIVDDLRQPRGASGALGS